MNSASFFLAALALIALGYAWGWHAKMDLLRSESYREGYFEGWTARNAEVDLLDQEAPHE